MRSLVGKISYFWISIRDNQEENQPTDKLPFKSIFFKTLSMKTKLLLFSRKLQPSDTDRKVFNLSTKNLLIWETQAVLLRSHMLMNRSDVTVQTGVSHCEPCLFSQSAPLSLTHAHTGVMWSCCTPGGDGSCITFLYIEASWPIAASEMDFSPVI